MHTLKELCEQFNLNESDIVNVYAYGSRIYGTHSPDSDYDYVVVFKSALLPSGAFKDNAKSMKIVAFKLFAIRAVVLKPA